MCLTLCLSFSGCCFSRFLDLCIKIRNFCLFSSNHCIQLFFLFFILCLHSFHFLLVFFQSCLQICNLLFCLYVFLQLISIICMYILYIFSFIYQIRKIFGCYKCLKCCRISLFIHELNTLFHRLVLFLLFFLCRLQIFLCLTDLFTFRDQIFFQIAKLCHNTVQFILQRLHFALLRSFIFLQIIYRRSSHNRHCNHRTCNHNS